MGVGTGGRIIPPALLFDVPTVEVGTGVGVVVVVVVVVAAMVVVV